MSTRAAAGQDHARIVRAIFESFGFEPGQGMGQIDEHVRKSGFWAQPVVGAGAKPALIGQVVEHGQPLLALVAEDPTAPVGKEQGGAWALLVAATVKVQVQGLVVRRAVLQMGQAFDSAWTDGPGNESPGEGRWPPSRNLCSLWCLRIGAAK